MTTSMAAVLSEKQDTQIGRRDAQEKVVQISARNFNFYYGAFHALKNINIEILRDARDRVHRAVGLRQVDVPALLQPHVSSSTRSSAPRGSSCSTGRNILAQGRGPDRSCARDSRHGVPEAHAVPDVHLRQHRLRRVVAREAGQGPDGRAGGMGPAQRARCGTRSRTCLGQSWHAVCPAGSSSACASRARIAVKPRGPAPRRADLRARPHRDGEHRAADRTS